MDFRNLIAEFAAKNGIDGIDGARGTFTLCRRIDGEVEYVAFERAVASFVTALRLVRRELVEGEVSMGEPPPAFDRFSGGPFMQV